MFPSLPWECRANPLLTKGLSINAKTCFESLSTSGLRVHQIRVFPLTLSWSKNAFRENRQSPKEGEGGGRVAATSPTSPGPSLVRRGTFLHTGLYLSIIRNGAAVLAVSQKLDEGAVHFLGLLLVHKMPGVGHDHLAQAAWEERFHAFEQLAADAAIACAVKD